MKISRANVADYAREKGLEPIQIDGIPEGFSFIEPDLWIGEKLCPRLYKAFIPMMDWYETPNGLSSDNLKELQSLYKYREEKWIKTKK